ncbi:MAG: ATP-binding cassette domain-containing protein [Pseudonocardiaceae bacterium]
MTSAPVLQLSAVSKRYGTLTAVSAADLAVAAGEIVGIRGASGSGKSTLLRLLAAIEPPSSGEVRLGGVPAWRRRYGSWRRQVPRPGFVTAVFQDPLTSLDAHWPLWRSITEPLMAGPRSGRPSRVARQARAAQALAGVGLDHLDLLGPPTELSVGQAQRVAILRAVIAAPAAVVADEPTSALDVTTAAGILALLRTVADAGTALVVVSHDQDMLAVLVDRVLPMTSGRLASHGDAGLALT